MWCPVLKTQQPLNLQEEKRCGFEINAHAEFTVQIILGVKSPGMKKYVLNVFKYLMGSFP